MTIKQLRSMSVLLVTVLLLGILPPLPVFAVVTAPSGFTGNEISAVNLGVDKDYPWHAMTADEATKYGLSGKNVYIAGNSGKDENGKASTSVSNLAITVTKAGALTFDYALSTKTGAMADLYFLGYGIDEPIPATATTATTSYFAQGQIVPVNGNWESYEIPVDENMLGDDGAVTIYIAYRHGTYNGSETDGSLNFAAIRNVIYTSGDRSDVVQFEDGSETMGTVTAELQVVTVTQDKNGNDVESITYTAADINKLKVGNIYRLKAEANEGYQFYGWVRHYTYNDNQYSAFFPYETDGAEITVDADTYYVPIFAAEGTYYIRKDATFYKTDIPINEVLDDAAAGNTVALVDDYTIPASVTELTVPAGVTFYLPYRDIWGAAEYGKKYHENIGGTLSISGMDKAYVTLTIPETTTLTVNGELILGAERNAATQEGFQGHISGRFGRINNNGTINMENGSVLTCYGLIDGTGTLLAKDGSTVKESLIISDYSGGNNSLKLYNQDQMPFKRYSAQNVQCRMQMEAKSKLVAMAVLYAMHYPNEVEVNLLGSDSSVVFMTQENRDHSVILDRTYDADKQITSGSANCTAGIGKSTWNVYGGLIFQTLTISLESVIQLSTARSPFPIPYNMEMILNSGTYTIATGLTLLPGSKLTVNSGATLDMSGKLYIYDGLVQSAMSGDKYPTREDLDNAGFSGTGEFILNGNMYVHSGATLGGVIQSEAPGAVLTIEEGVHLVNSSNNLMTLDPTLLAFNKQAESRFDEWAILGRNDVGGITTVHNWIVQDGGAGLYDDNTTWFNIPARIWNGTELQQLKAGTYLSKTGSNTISDQYVCRYVPEIATYTEEDGLTYEGGTRYMNDGTETFTRTVSGTWTAKSEGVDITSSTVAGSDKTGTLTEGVTLETVTVKNDDGSFTLSITPKKDGADFTTKMVYLIKCTNADTTITTAEKIDGGWILPEGTVSVTIEACLLGDITGDGLINITDLAMERRTVAGTFVPGELALLAGDANSDGTVNITDLAMIRRYVAGTYKW